VREVFTEEFKDALAFLAQVMPGDGSSRRDEDAIAAFASMVGALILARAVNDEPLSDRILQVTAKRVTQSVTARKPAHRVRRSG
jgi:TetR/AcrR family transcriptional repressor of nem operon